MLRLFLLGLLTLTCALSACSQKARRGATAEDRRAESSIEGAQKFYYTDLQIVSETKVVGSCSDEKKNSTRFELEPSMMLNDKEELAGPGRFQHHVVNVSMQVMGFDSSKYVFTSLDSWIPTEVPFGIRLRRLPGLILELQYLDQSVKMKLRDTPVYSFTATEKRGDCTLEHQVNVFGEHTGFYRLASD